MKEVVPFGQDAKINPTSVLIRQREDLLKIFSLPFAVQNGLTGYGYRGQAPGFGIKIGRRFFAPKTVDR